MGKHMRYLIGSVDPYNSDGLDRMLDESMSKKWKTTQCLNRVLRVMKGTRRPSDYVILTGYPDEKGNGVEDARRGETRNDAFVVGARVRVREKLKGKNRYGDLYFNPDMEQYRGKSFIIEQSETEHSILIFKLKGVSEWWWSKEMLELVGDDKPKDHMYPGCAGCVRSSHNAHCALAGSSCKKYSRHHANDDDGFRFIAGCPATERTNGTFARGGMGRMNFPIGTDRLGDIHDDLVVRNEDDATGFEQSLILTGYPDEDGEEERPVVGAVYAPVQEKVKEMAYYEGKWGKRTPKHLGPYLRLTGAGMEYRKTEGGPWAPVGNGDAWGILSMLRGPDMSPNSNDLEYLKKLTTGRIRGLFLDFHSDRTETPAHPIIVVACGGTTMIPRELSASEKDALTALLRNGGEHFRGHWQSAETVVRTLLGKWPHSEK